MGVGNPPAHSRAMLTKLQKGPNIADQAQSRQEEAGCAADLWMLGDCVQ